MRVLNEPRTTCAGVGSLQKESDLGSYCNARQATLAKATGWRYHPADLPEGISDTLDWPAEWTGLEQKMQQDADSRCAIRENGIHLGNRDSLDCRSVQHQHLQMDPERGQPRPTTRPQTMHTALELDIILSTMPVLNGIGGALRLERLAIVLHQRMMDQKPT